MGLLEKRWGWAVGVVYWDGFVGEALGFSGGGGGGYGLALGGGEIGGHTSDYLIPNS